MVVRRRSPSVGHKRAAPSAIRLSWPIGKRRCTGGFPWIAGFFPAIRAGCAGPPPAGGRAPGVVLDPFAGVGTTLIEADLAGHETVGFEINPYAVFPPRGRSWGRTGWSPHGLAPASWTSSRSMGECEHSGRAPQASPPAAFRTRAPFYSPAVERKVLSAFDFIATLEGSIAALFRLAFAATMVNYSNYSYEPSLGRKASVGRPDVEDDDVADVIATKLSQMAEDIDWYGGARANPKRDDGRVFEQSFFDGYTELGEGNVDLLVTSPPYLNNYHYNRNTRPAPLLAGVLRRAARPEAAGGTQRRHLLAERPRRRAHRPRHFHR